MNYESKNNILYHRCITWYTERGKNVEVLESVMAVVWPDEKTRWRLEADQVPQPEDKQEQALVPADSELMEHPTVQAVLDIFGGSVAPVEAGKKPKPH